MILTLEVVGPAAEALGAARRRVFDVRGGTIGRRPDNSWVLLDQRVSGYHAVITFENGEFFIRDTSTNGTFVDARNRRLARGQSHRLESGHRLFIDPYEIRVMIASEGDFLEFGGSSPDALPPREVPLRSGGEQTTTFSPSALPPPPAAAPQPRPAAPGAAEHRAGAATEPTKGGHYTVWFGTNRKPSDETRSSLFTGDRDDRVHYGSCRVAVPDSHRIGSIGSPWWQRLMRFTDDRLKILKTEVLAENEYRSEVAKALQRAPIGERDVVVFLHGYNVSFEQAALRAAQLGFDLGIAGVMAFYSWPSKGTLAGYPSDEASIEASEHHIADYLTAMATTSGAENVHVIAHSMGNRGLLRAIDRIAASAAARSMRPFNQIILAAADVDQDTFKRLSVAYQRVAQRTTMYVCSKDVAVEASHWLHAYPRAGLIPPVLVVPGIDTINVSNLDLTLLGHGYVADARELLTDIHTLLRHGTAPAQRFGLRQESTPAGTYWIVGR